MIQHRLANEISRRVSFIVREMFSDHVVSVIKTEMSDGIKTANIYVSIYGSDREKAFRLLKKKRPFIRKMLAMKMKIRKIPNLKFMLDYGLEVSQKMSDLLNNLNKENKE